MKRINWAIIIVSVILTVLIAGCTAPASAGVYKAADSAVFETIYSDMEGAGVLPEMMPLGEEYLLDYYGIDPSLVTAQLVYISFDNMLADEVVLMQAKDSASADEVEEWLNKRLAAKADEAEGYSPEQFAIIKACSVVRHGETVAMIVSPEAARLTEIFDEGLK